MNARPHRYLSLVAAQITLMVVLPLVQQAAEGRLIFLGTVTLVSAAAIYSIDRHHLKVILGLVFMVPTFISLWLGQSDQSGTLVYWGLAGACLFFTYCGTLVLTDVLKTRDVNMDIIAGGVSVYFQIGIVWSFLYMILGHYAGDSAAFAFAPGFGRGTDWVQLDSSEAIYFSFVTLSTLGYGDILPVSPFARTLAYLEALIGQIYLVVLIARLVGLHLSKPGRGQRDLS